MEIPEPYSQSLLDFLKSSVLHSLTQEQKIYLVRIMIRDLLKIVTFKKIVGPLSAKKMNTLGIGDEQYQEFINLFNETRKSKFQVLDLNAKRQYIAARNAGYTNEDLITVLKQFMSDEYHIKKKFTHLTPEFITRPDKIDKGINMALEQQNTGESIVDKKFIDDYTERHKR